MKTLLLVDSSSEVAESVFKANEELATFESILDVATVDAAVEHLKNQRIDVMLADSRLIVDGGFQLLRTIKKSGQEHGPVIALVDINQVEDIELVIKAGVSDFVFKPLREIELKERIKSALSKPIAAAKGMGAELPLIESMAEGLIILNPDETIQMVNKRFCEIFGYDSEEICGLPVTRMIAPDDLVSITGFKSSLSRKKITGMTVSFLTQDGQRIPTMLSGAATLDSNNKLNAMVLVVRDNRELQKILTHESRAVAAERDRVAGLEEIRDQLKQKAIALEEQTGAALLATQNALRLQKEAEIARDGAVKEHESAERLRQIAVSTAERLQELDKKRTSFFQGISHELRTPLTLILNPLDLLVESMPDNKYFNMVRMNAYRMLKLVNQLLDYQKVQAGKKKLHIVRVNLVDFLVNSVDYFKTACEARGIEFDVRVGDRDLRDAVHQHQNIFVWAEPDALEKITFNYLSNSLRFTPRGGRITLALDEVIIQDGSRGRGPSQEEADSYARISVTDTGPGIPLESQSDIFDVFTQVDIHRTSTHGTGLGLALARELAERIGGHVGVESSEGEGAKFWADFPSIEHDDLSVDILIFSDAISGVQLQSWIDSSSAGYATRWVSSLDDAVMVAETFKVGCLICHESALGSDIGLLFKTLEKRSSHTPTILLADQKSNDFLRAYADDPNVRIFFPDEIYRSTLLTALGTLLSNPSNLSPKRAQEEESQWTTDFLNVDVDGINEHSEVVDEIEEYQYGSKAEGQAILAAVEPDAPLILVIDDLRDMRLLVADTVHRAGYRCVGLSGGHIGLEYAKRHPTALMIIDWMMPGMGGPEVIRNIRTDEMLEAIPVILLTARSDEESRIIGAEIGADAFLGKPFNSQELNSQVRNLLSLQTAERRISRIQRQQALAQIAGEVAHELNNPLNYISTGVGTVVDQLKRVERMLAALFKDAGDEAEPIRKGFSDILDVSRNACDGLISGTRKAGKVVQELRGVTEVDGRIRLPIQPGLMFDDEVLELKEYSAKRYEHLQWQNRISIAYECLANPFVLRRILAAVVRHCAESVQCRISPLITFKLGDESESWTSLVVTYKRSELDDELYEFLSRGIGDAGGDLSPAGRLATLALLFRDHGGQINMSEEGEEARLQILIPQLFERKQAVNALKSIDMTA